VVKTSAVADGLQRAQLSPRRHSSQATATTDELVAEQLAQFGISPDSPHDAALAELVRHLGAANGAPNEVWNQTAEVLSRVGSRRPNAKRFVSFQLAKILDTLQNPIRATYQTLVDGTSRRGIRGPYPQFDNVTAIFSATPVITRTATYVYACTEWVEDAFQGREFLHQSYSRLLNPKSICLANHIVDPEAGPESAEYFAWNFNSAPVRGWHVLRDQGGKIVCPWSSFSTKKPTGLPAAP
jgi:O-acetylhomoserine (thiol)-lyase